MARVLLFHSICAITAVSASQGLSGLALILMNQCRRCTGTRQTRTNKVDALLLLPQAKHHMGTDSFSLMPYEAARHQSSLLGANILYSQYEYKA